MCQQRPTLTDLERAVAAAPHDAAAARQLGKAFAERREYEDAAEYLMRATQLDPARPTWCFELADALSALERWESAVHARRAGLALAYHPGAALELARLYDRLGDTSAAVDTCAAAVRHAPHSRTAHIELFTHLLDHRTAGEADALAAELTPGVVHTPLRAFSLNDALQRHGRYPEALDRWTNVGGHVAGDRDVLLGLATVHTAMGDLDAAERVLRRGLELFPVDPEMIVEHLTLLERLGAVEALRARVVEPVPRRCGGLWLRCLHPEDAPIWDGTQRLEGKTVLVESFGGYGDIVQYCRFVSLLKAHGASVVVRVPPRLRTMLETLRDADDVVAPFEPCRPFDYQCGPLQPAYFLDWSWRWLDDTTPYLAIDRDLERHWRQRLGAMKRPGGDGLRVGILWCCADRHDARDAYTFRAAPLVAFEVLARVPGITLHGLQVGPGIDELTPATSQWLAGNLPLDATDFRDAAAAIHALDAIVSIDSSLAHLAGALRKPCFMLLPFLPAARWMAASPRSRDHACVWYPSTRMFVQARPGDWSSALTDVAVELAARAARPGEPRPVSA